MPVAEIEPSPAARRKLAIELAAYVAVAFAIT
jgi:hypothetical protein